MEPKMYSHVHMDPLFFSNLRQMTLVHTLTLHLRYILILLSQLHLRIWSDLSDLSFTMK
jgi:hypothetical protein